MTVQYSPPSTPTFSTQKLRKQLHQSGEQLLGKCGLAFEFRYLKGLRKPPASYLLRGTAVDASVGEDLNTKINTGELVQDSKVLTDIARDAVEHHPEKDSFVPDEDEQGMNRADLIDQIKDTSVRLALAHHSEIAPKIQPRIVHRRFALNMDKWLRGKAKIMHQRAEDAENSWLKRVLHQQAAYLNAAAREGFDFVGEFDVEEEYPSNIFDKPAWGIRDLKTSKKSPSAETANTSHQLTFYALAMKVLDGHMPTELHLDYVIDLKRGPKTDILTTTRDEMDCEASLSRIVSAIVSIRSGVFTPAPQTAWWCSPKYCGYHSICPAVKRTVTSVPSSPLVQITVDPTKPIGSGKIDD